MISGSSSNRHRPGTAGPQVHPVLSVDAHGPKYNAGFALLQEPNKMLARIQ